MRRRTRIRRSTWCLQTNFEDGGGEDTFFRFVGSGGVLTVGWTELTLKQVGIHEADRESGSEGLQLGGDLLGGAAGGVRQAVPGGEG